jgi:hypothetical protein
VRAFHIDGIIDADDRIYEDCFIDDLGGEMELGATVGALVPIQRATMRFAHTWTEMRIESSGVLWVSIEPMRKDGDWVDIPHPMGPK